MGQAWFMAIAVIPVTVSYSPPLSCKDHHIDAFPNEGDDLIESSKHRTRTLRKNLGEWSITNADSFLGVFQMR